MDGKTQQVSKNPCDPRPVECISQLNRIESMAAANGKKLTTLCVLMTGNGNPEAGLLVRTDRLEQKSKLATWALRVVIGAILAGGSVAAIATLTARAASGEAP